MLDAQRYRGAVLREEVYFTRKLMVTHIAMAIVTAALFFSHGYLTWGLLASVWFALSLLFISGMTHGRQGSRVGLALFFFLYSAAGLFFLLWYQHEYVPKWESILPTSLAPLWLGMLNLAYLAGGLTLLINIRCRKAVSIGFSLW